MAFLDYFSPQVIKEQTTVSKPSKEAQPYYEELWEKYGPAIGRGQPMPSFAMTAPLTPWQESLLATGQGLEGQVTPFTESPLWQPMVTGLMSAMGGEMGAQPITPEETEQYFGRAIYDPSKKMLERDVLPAVSEAWGGRGFTHTEELGQRQEVIQDWADYINAQRAQTEWDVAAVNRAIEEARAERALGAGSQALTAIGAPAAGTTAQAQTLAALSGLAGIPQAQQQAEINEQVQRFAAANRITDPETLQVIQWLMGLPFGSNVVSGTTTVQPSMASVIGGLGTAALTGGQSFGQDKNIWDALLAGLTA
ncbi:MAG: hypothetical protein AMJ75_00250 [Phycisphaerae bacterium SM1_79]|nr:MAG: hypothetical protein AMJ75_00250 [Phycisphaerae bacterium SM1_79]